MEDPVGDHMTHCRARNLRPSTIYQRRRVLARFAAYRGRRSLLTASTGDVEAFLARLEVPESRAAELSHLRAFYRWAVESKRIRVDPTTRVVRPKLRRRLPRPMGSPDAALAIATAPSRVRPMLLLAAYAGLRACEIARVRAEDLLYDQDPPVLIVTEGKGGDMGAVPLRDELAAALKADPDLPSVGWLFPRRDGRPGPVPPWVVSRLANNHLHSLGIAHTLHTLRHWFGTETYRASGRDIRATQELLRHRTPVSTALYTYLAPAETAAVVDRLPVLA